MTTCERPVSDAEKILADHPSLLWHHCGNSRACHGTPGLPDLVIIGRRVRWREGKPHPGKHPAGGQLAWKYGLLALGADWSTWTTADAESGRIRREIEELL
jgi:hypothetical protein